MSKIVYLLGAGASRGIRRTDDVNYKHSSNESNIIIEGLPLVNEIPERLNYWVNYLNNYEPNTDNLRNIIFPQGATGGTGYEKAIELLTKDLTWLKEESSRHATIDTFAKKLYLTNKKDSFCKVELLLTIFFILEQFHNKPDGRYDTFLASILTKELEIPKDISILTWNYDSQFEIAYTEYAPDVDYNYIHNKLYVYDAKTDRPTSDIFHTPSRFIHPDDQATLHNVNATNPHKIIKLNGTANFTDKFAITDFLKVDEEDIKLQRLLNKYILYNHSNKQDDYTRLSFAWDNQWYINSLIENQLEKIIGDAEILVVIGYTFPFFNRETDRRIFEIMQNLSKVYIQDPNAINLLMNIEPVLSSAQIYANEILKGDRISPITNTSQFFLPPEL